MSAKREKPPAPRSKKFEKSGITLAVSGPAVAAMQTISSQMEAASDTKDARMQGLAGRERDAGGDANIVAAQTASCASHFLPARSGWSRSLL